MRIKCLIGLSTLSFALSACGQSNDLAQNSEFIALQDRIAIEDLLTEYYSHLGSGTKDDFGKFFTDDAVMDINGIVLTGKQEIHDIYNRPATEPTAPQNEDPLALHMDYMHMTNPLIRVNGDTATAQMFWTGVISGHVNELPQFEEMGREYDLLVKVDGEWLIHKRVVVADGGMPESMNDTYQRYNNYDILTEN